MSNRHITVVNNTGANLRDFTAYFVAVANGVELPEEIADLFNIKVVKMAAADVRVIVNFAD